MGTFFNRSSATRICGLDRLSQYYLYNIDGFFKKYLQTEEGLGTIGYTYHDYHKETPKGKNLSEALGSKMRLSNGQSQLQEYGFTHFTEEGFMSQQSGILRTNCLDCLDRTNAVQTLFALEALEMLLESFSIDANHSNKFKGKFLTILISYISYNMAPLGTPDIATPHPFCLKRF